MQLAEEPEALRAFSRLIYRLKNFIPPVPAFQAVELVRADYLSMLHLTHDNTGRDSD